MHTKTWKKERDLLSEAYQSINETTHENDAPALGPDEERQKDGSVKNTKTGETVYTPKNKEKVEEDAIPGVEPEVGVDTGEMPSEPVAELEPEPETIPADVQPVVDYIRQKVNDDLDSYAAGGRLEEFWDAVKAGLDAVQKQRTLDNPQPD